MQGGGGGAWNRIKNEYGSIDINLSDIGYRWEWLMNKQNELILTESALEDFKIFKMYMGKKNLFFISLPICCFQKTASLCGFSQVIDYQQMHTSIQSFNMIDYHE